jgi:transposase-like protein
MPIIERGRRFVESLRALAGRTATDWRRCPYCQDTQTSKWGSYPRQPWTLDGRQTVLVPRHRCLRCRRTYSETAPNLVRYGWYGRDVRRCAIDLWQYGGSSVRRTAAWLRAWLGRQERWQHWRPLDAAPVEPARCWLSASTVQRWLDGAGQAAQATVPAQLAGVPCSGQVGLDGLWARLTGQGRRVVLGLVDCVTGVLWPPVVTEDEQVPSWTALGGRAQQAGLALDDLRGVVSDGASGLVGYVASVLDWVNHQRCVFHLWQGLARALNAQATDAATGLAGAAATAVKRKTRGALVGLVRAVFDAASGAASAAALAALAADPRGAKLASLIQADLDAALVHLGRDQGGLARVAPEWVWRDFRLRLSHGRNHRTAARLERAALLFAVYHNFEPAQERSERKRHYRRSGRCPLAVAGVPPDGISYLDALAI